MLCRVTSPSVTLSLSLQFYSLFICLFIFVYGGVFVPARRLSLVTVSRGYSLRCISFSLQWLLLFGAQALGVWTSTVVVMSELRSCRSQAPGMQSQ